MRRLRAHWRLAAVLMLVAAVVLVALWPSAIEVDLAQVQRGVLQVTIDEEGETRVRERYHISAPVAGRLHRITLEPGDAIARGRTVLAELTPAPPALIDRRAEAELGAGVEAAQASVGQARAERARAGATLDRARDTLRRQRELADAGLVSRDELEAAETAVRAADEAQRAAEYAVRRAEYDLQMARARLRRPDEGGTPIRILSPIDGLVLRRIRESEAVVPAGEPLLEVGSLGDLEVVADLLSTDAVRVSPGDAVRLEQWGGGDAIAGRVRRVEPSGFLKVSALGVEEQRVNVIIDFIDPAEAARRLGDGYRVEVRVVVWEGVDVLTVPLGSLFRRGAEWAVFVVQDGRARLQPVEIGQRNGTDAQVLHGLNEEDAVVLHPPDTLSDGMRIAERQV